MRVFLRNKTSSFASSRRASRHTKQAAGTSCRPCLRAILVVVKPRRVHLPFYICQVVLEQLATCGVEPMFYGLDERLHAVRVPEVRVGDMLLVVNYFGLHSERVRQLAARFGERCIVDNAQSYFDPAPEGGGTLNSARKFFGVPDGAFLGAPRHVGV